MRIATPILVTLMLGFGAAVVAAEDGKNYRGTKDDQEACTPDVYRLCQAHIPDEDRIVACLKANKAKLSPACRKVFSGD
jgi:hypothetical protein